MIQFENYRRNDLQKNINVIGTRPLDVMAVGVTGAGKSTTMNSFFQKSVAKVGRGVEPETMELDSYMLNDYFRIWDTPGLGDGVEVDQIHKKKMTDLLWKTYSLSGVDYGYIDMVLVIVEGANRDMGTTYSLLSELIVPNIQPERVLVILNQADVAMKGRHWNYNTQEPDEKLLSFLDTQVLSIQERVKEATGLTIPLPVYYSAEYNWNIARVFDFIIDHMPKTRRKLLLNR